jgi:hypothetical protein
MATSFQQRPPASQQPQLAKCERGTARTVHTSNLLISPISSLSSHHHRHQPRRPADIQARPLALIDARRLASRAAFSSTAAAAAAIHKWGHALPSPLLASSRLSLVPLTAHNSQLATHNKLAAHMPGPL